MNRLRLQVKRMASRARLDSDSLRRGPATGAVNPFANAARVLRERRRSLARVGRCDDTLPEQLLFGALGLRRPRALARQRLLLRYGPRSGCSQRSRGRARGCCERLARLDQPVHEAQLVQARRGDRLARERDLGRDRLWIRRGKRTSPPKAAIRPRLTSGARSASRAPRRRGRKRARPRSRRRARTLDRGDQRLARPAIDDSAKPRPGTTAARQRERLEVHTGAEAWGAPVMTPALRLDPRRGRRAPPRAPAPWRGRSRCAPQAG